MSIDKETVRAVVREMKDKAPLWPKQRPVLMAMADYIAATFGVYASPLDGTPIRTRRTPARETREAPACEQCGGKGTITGRTDGGGATDGEFEYEMWCPRCREESGAERIATERQRQIAKGYTPEHEDTHDTDGELARAAACYLTPPLGSAWGSGAPPGWPWAPEDWKPRDRVSNLVRAGALIAAEIDRLQRREAPAPELSTDDDDVPQWLSVEDLSYRGGGIMSRRRGRPEPSTDTLREALERLLDATPPYIDAALRGSMSIDRHRAAYREAREAAREAVLAAPGPRGRGACEHDWIDMRNEVIESGEMCSHCGALRAAPWQEGR